MSVNPEIIKRTEYCKTLPPSLEVADAFYQYGLYAEQKDFDTEYAQVCWSLAKQTLDSIILEKAHGTWVQLDEYCITHDTSTPLIDKYYEILKVESRYNFESFIFYMERHRKPDKRFYAPRMGTLGQVAQDLSDLDNGKYKFVGVSLPARSGKSTLCIFFLAWIACKRPNSHSAMGGHSGILAKGFYKELLNLIITPEYTFKELFDYMHPQYAGQKFPTSQSAEDFTITLGDPDRFATITCRGADGTWTGAVDISRDGYLYIDDLVRDREHSLSPQRMENTFQEYLNKMVDRKNDGAKELMVGTLWSVIDPLERMRVAHEGEPGYLFRRIPALDENDESNFKYTRNGFSTEYYREMRDRLDNAEWMAKYQQKPYVREGLIFPLNELNYFNGVLPDGDSRVISAVDCSFGGGDNLSMPIGREYADGSVYIFDWVHNPGAKEVTLPLVSGKIIENEIRQIRFEGNQGGDMYAGYVDDMLRSQNYKCSCTSKRAPNNMAKMEKIIAYAGDIKRKYYFLQEKKPTQQELEEDAKNGIKRYVRSKEYQKAMDELGMTVMVGKNTHEDAADALTQLEMFREGGSGGRVEVMKNPFKAHSFW